MPERVRITDVSPRDGLQNEAGIVPTCAKLELIDSLVRTGVDEVEITSFVSPKWIPQLADAEDVCAGMRKIAEGRPLSSSPTGRRPVFSALVPNIKGMERLLVQRSAGLPLKIALFAAASETFSQKNTNASITETMNRIDAIVKQAKERRLRLRGYLSCAIACPFEGPIEPDVVAKWALRLCNLGIEEIDLGDTIGAGTPETVRAMLRAVFDAMNADHAEPLITLHLHDTFGKAADCVKAALDMGVRSFDGSVAGLGGCPYASTPMKRAPGNISTETLVRTVHEAGFETGVDLDKLSESAAIAQRIVQETRQQDDSPLTRLDSVETPSPPRGEGGKA